MLEMLVYAFPFQKGLPSSISLAKNKIYLDAHLKEELNNFFKSYRGIPYSHTGRVDRNVNTLLMDDINHMPNYVRD